MQSDFESNQVADGYSVLNGLGGKRSFFPFNRRENICALAFFRDFKLRNYKIFRPISLDREELRFRSVMFNK